MAKILQFSDYIKLDKDKSGFLQFVRPKQTVSEKKRKIIIKQLHEEIEEAWAVIRKWEKETGMKLDNTPISKRPRKIRDTLDIIQVSEYLINNKY